MTRSIHRTEILIAGEAGRGTLFAGEVLAEAATTAGIQVTFTSRTGAAVRSGAAEAHVILSTEPILYPYIEGPDLVIALSAAAATRWIGRLSQGGRLLFDPSDPISDIPESVRTAALPAREAIRNAGLPAGNENLLFLGALSEIWGGISMRALRSGLRRTLAGASEPAEAALLLGASLCGSEKAGR